VPGSISASPHGIAVGPFAAFILTAYGVPTEMPVLDFSEMSPILLGMLGLGALRTHEKIKGVA